MIGAFNSVYTALQGFFSRAFWFAAFLPVALFAGAHILIERHVFGTVSLFGFHLDFGSKPTDAATNGTLVMVMVVLVVIAYALQPLMPLFRGILDGSLLPRWLHNVLRYSRWASVQAQREQYSTALADVGALAVLNEDAHRAGGRLKAAFAAATLLANPISLPNLATARQALNKLRRRLASPGSFRQAALDAHRHVLTALATNNPDPDTLQQLRGAAFPLSQQDIDISQQTRAAVDELEELLRQAAREASYRLESFITRNRLAEAIDIPRATEIGDARFVTEQYSSDTYKVRFDFLWPRLLVAIKSQKADDPTLEVADMARAKVDFAVLCLALAISVPTVWMPILLWKRQDLGLFLGIGLATPPLLVLFYHLVLEGTLAFGEIVKTTIDQSRFLVLKMLQQTEPLSRSEERELWARITTAHVDGRLADLFYTKGMDHGGSK